MPDKTQRAKALLGRAEPFVTWASCLCMVLVCFVAARPGEVAALENQVSDLEMRIDCMSTSMIEMIQERIDRYEARIDDIELGSAQEIMLRRLRERKAELEAQQENDE